MLTVSKRLEKIAGLVPKGARVADIGADHGYLSIFIEKTKNPEKIQEMYDIGYNTLMKYKDKIME